VAVEQPGTIAKGKEWGAFLSPPLEGAESGFFSPLSPCERGQGVRGSGQQHFGGGLAA